MFWVVMGLSVLVALPLGACVYVALDNWVRDGRPSAAYCQESSNA